MSQFVCVFVASRTLYGLSCDCHAPRIFQRCNSFGTPYVAVALTCVLFPLVYLDVGNNTSVVFGWFVNITTVAGLIGWIVIEVTYLRFYAGLEAQGYSRKGWTPRLQQFPRTYANFLIADLPYRSPGQPYVSWITLVAVLLIVFFSGFDVFTAGNFTASKFLTCYLAGKTSSLLGFVNKLTSLQRCTCSLSSILSLGSSHLPK